LKWAGFAHVHKYLVNEWRRPNRKRIVVNQSHDFPFNPTTAQRCRSEKENNILEDLFSSVLLQFKEYHSFGNLKFNNLGIFQSLKSRILKEIILPISLRLNFTPNTLVCYGLRCYAEMYRE